MSRKTTKGKKIPSLAPGFSNFNLCMFCKRDNVILATEVGPFCFTVCCSYHFQRILCLKKCNFAIYELIWYDANPTFNITRES